MRSSVSLPERGGRIREEGEREAEERRRDDRLAEYEEQYEEAEELEGPEEWAGAFDTGKGKKK